MVFAVTYDLNKAGQDYDALYKKIQSLGQTCHPLQNLWLLSTNYSAETILNEIRKVIDSNDSVFICQLYRGSYSAWMSKEAHSWLEARL